MIVGSARPACAARQARRPPEPPPTSPKRPAEDGERRYPLRLDGRLDEDLSRWMWLVKWFLAIPHYIVLAFLWLAFGVLTVIAFFAILFTGRYPRGDLRLQRGRAAMDVAGVVLLVQRLGTDRYPPFTLDAARLSGPAPRRVSRRAVARPRAGEVVVAGDPALPRRRPARGRAVATARWSRGTTTTRGRRVVRPRWRPDRNPRRRRRRCPALRRVVSEGTLPARDRAQPLGVPRRRLRRADDRRVPAVPPRPGRPRSGNAAAPEPRVRRLRRIRRSRTSRRRAGSCASRGRSSNTRTPDSGH